MRVGLCAGMLAILTGLLMLAGGCSGPAATIPAGIAAASALSQALNSPEPATQPVVLTECVQSIAVDTLPPAVKIAAGFAVPFGHIYEAEKVYIADDVTYVVYVEKEEKQWLLNISPNGRLLSKELDPASIVDTDDAEEPDDPEDAEDDDALSPPGTAHMP